MISVSTPGCIAPRWRSRAAPWKGEHDIEARTDDLVDNACWEVSRRPQRRADHPGNKRRRSADEELTRVRRPTRSSALLICAVGRPWGA